MVAPLLADPRLIERFVRPMGALARYHRHQVVGMDRIPDDGPALLVFNHSLATYDAMIFSVAVWKQMRRLPCGLGDNLIFRVPGLAGWARRAGIVPASPDNGRRLLEEGHLVGVAPGGMREALRPSDQRYTVRWDRRRGFVRLAMEAAAPIVLIACPAADELFDVYENRLTKLAYRQWRLPLPLIRGFGPTLVPKPVALTHYVGTPILSERFNGPVPQEAVDEMHAHVVASMNRLMSESAG